MVRAHGSRARGIPAASSRRPAKRRLRAALGEPRMRSSEVGSAQCRSSKASTTGCERAPARTQAVIAASCRRRNSSGANFAARSSGSGMSTSGASRGAYSAASRPISPRVFSRSARRRSSAASAPPNRSRPHSAIGCRGVFCRSCEAAHSTQVCGVSASLARNSSISRDLPMPGSPTIWTNWPSPSSARAQRRVEQRKLVLAADERRQGARPAAPAAAARAHDAVERDRRRHALELMRALVLGDEKPGGLALHARGDEHRPGSAARLHPRGDVRRFAEHFAGRIDHDGPALEADAGGELGRARSALRALRSASARWMASAARTARSASFSCACG